MNLTNELFTLIHTRDGYRHIGLDLSYKFYADRDGHRLFVCFQGSNGLRDWKNNLLAVPSRAAEPYRGCGWKVHGGFAGVWRSGNDAVIREARELWEKYSRSRPLPGGGHGAYKLVFCGFSHGAALAQLAAEDCGSRFGGVYDCVCFGSPKLAWGTRALTHLQRSIRLTNWINRADLITALPFRALGYRHVREDFVNVRRIPLLSSLRVFKHHQVYDRKEIYP